MKRNLSKQEHQKMSLMNYALEHFVAGEIQIPYATHKNVREKKKTPKPSIFR